MILGGNAIWNFLGSDFNSSPFVDSRDLPGHDHGAGEGRVLRLEVDRMDDPLAGNDVDIAGLYDIGIFGRLHFGAIKGLAQTITVAGSAAGPFLVAWGFEVSGSYRPVLWSTALLPLGLAVVVPFLPLRREGRIL